MKKIVWITGIALVSMVGYVGAGPYLTVLSIKTAIIEKNDLTLAQHINFPVLRENVKDQLNTKLMDGSKDQIKQNPLAVLAASLASTMVDSVVDSVITPSGLTAIIEGKKQYDNAFINTTPAPDSSASNAVPPSNIPSNTAPLSKDDLFKNARFSYDSISEFSVWMKDDRGEEVRFVLQRTNLSWKLVNIVLPIAKMS